MPTTVHVQARGCEVDSALRSHFQNRVDALEKVWSRLDDAEVRLRCERGQTIAELTIYASGGLITRAEERAPDMRQAFDLALHKLQNQLRRYKDKVQDRSRRQNNREPDGTIAHPIAAPDVAVPTVAVVNERMNGNGKTNGANGLNGSVNEGVDVPLATGDGLADGDESPATMVRVKRFQLKPMSPDEAALQMDLLGHDFFVFRNPRDNSVGVVYRRSSGGYGLIEPVSD